MTKILQTFQVKLNTNLVDDVYGEELIVATEDVPQSSEEIVGNLVGDSLSDMYVPVPVSPSRNNSSPKLNSSR